MAAYEADRGQCVAVTMQAQAVYERHQLLRQESTINIGLIVGAIASAEVGGTLDALTGALVDDDYDPVASTSKIIDRCVKNRGHEILSDLSKSACGAVQSLQYKKPPDICLGVFAFLGSPIRPVGWGGGLLVGLPVKLLGLRPSSTFGTRPDAECAPAR